MSSEEPRTAAAQSPLTSSRRKVNDRFRAEIRSLLTKIQEIDFSPHLSPLRPGHGYELEIPSRVRDLRHGGVNLHLPVTWDDGLKWLVRVKLHCVVAFGMIAAEVRKAALDSERETMLFLHNNGLAVPRVFGPVVVTDEIEFIVVECLDGRPCSRPITKDLSGDHVERVIQQLADFQVRLSNFKFPSIGSLYPSPVSAPTSPSPGSSASTRGMPEIGPSVSLRFYDPFPPYFLGPFATSGERYVANIDHVLSTIAQSGATTIGHPAVMYLVHLWLKDLVKSTPCLWAEEDIMLRHADDQGDHIFLDTDENLSGIIDWEWAVTASKSEAFAAPMGLVDTASFEQGSNELSAAEVSLAKSFEESSRPDLAECVRGGKLHQRLRAMIGGQPRIGMIHGLADAAGRSDQDPTAETLTEWCAIQSERYKEDVRLSNLARQDGLSWQERCEVKAHFDWL